LIPTIPPTAAHHHAICRDQFDGDLAPRSDRGRCRWATTTSIVDRTHPAGRRCAGRHQNRRISPQRVPGRRRVRGHDRRAAGSGLEQHQADRLGAGRHDHRIGCPIGVGDLGRRPAAREDNRKSAESALQPTAFRAVSDEREPPVQTALQPCSQHIGQQLEVLLGRKPPDANDLRTPSGTIYGAVLIRCGEDSGVDGSGPEVSRDAKPT
jgi:hypothetical protein